MPSNTLSPTLSMATPAGIFGDMFQKIADSAVSTIGTVLPVWAEDQLAKALGVDVNKRPTFQETTGSTVERGETMTTETAKAVNANDGGKLFTLSMNQILLLGGGALLVLVLLSK